MNRTRQRFALGSWVVLAAMATASTGHAQAPATSPRRGAALRVLVRPPTSSGAALFSDELALLGGTVAGWLEARPDLHIELVSPSTPAEPAECAAPLSEWDALRIQHGRMPRLSVHAYCTAERGCALSVRISRPPETTGAWETIRAWEASVDFTGDASDWTAAVRRLAPPPPREGAAGLLSARHVPDDAPPFELTELTAHGPFGEPPTVEAVSSQVQSRLGTCAADAHVGKGESAVVALRANGTVARCEAQLEHDPDGRRAPCVCRALERLRLGRGASDRRLELSLVNHTSSGARAGDRTVFASFRVSEMTGGFRAYPGFRDVTRAAARCYAEGGLVERSAIPVRVVVDSHGEVLSALVDARSLPRPVAQCLERAFAPLRFTCPAGNTTATWEGSLVSYSTGPEDEASLERVLGGDGVRLGSR